MFHFMYIYTDIMDTVIFKMIHHVFTLATHSVHGKK